MVVTVFVLELAFIMPAGLIWHLEDPFAKSFAVGLAATALMHLATVRSIYLPQALGGRPRWRWSCSGRTRPTG